MDELPREVREAIERRFLREFDGDGLRVVGRVNPRRVIWGHKAHEAKMHVWGRAIRSGVARLDEGPYGNGWRKCHTANYWVYYARDLASAVDMLADLVRD